MFSGNSCKQLGLKSNQCGAQECVRVLSDETSFFHVFSKTGSERASVISWNANPWPGPGMYLGCSLSTYLMGGGTFVPFLLLWPQHCMFLHYMVWHCGIFFKSFNAWGDNHSGPAWHIRWKSFSCPAEKGPVCRLGIRGHPSWGCRWYIWRAGEQACLWWGKATAWLQWS